MRNYHKNIPVRYRRPRTTTGTVTSRAESTNSATVDPADHQSRTTFKSMGSLREYKHGQDVWRDVPLLRYCIRHVGPSSQLEVCVWLRNPGHVDEFLSTGIQCQPTDLGGTYGIDGTRNVMAYLQISALRLHLYFVCSFALHSGRELTAELLHVAIGQCQQQPGYLPDMEQACGGFKGDWPVQVLSANARTKLQRRCRELRVAIRDGFSAYPIVPAYY